MKRYTVIDVMKATTDGTEIYYSRADLIAAGCLVPVSDGECGFSDWVYSQSKLAILDGDLVFNDSDEGFVVNALTGDLVNLPTVSDDEDDECVIVQPVRLVRLEDVG